LDRRIVNPPRVRSGGVRAGVFLGAGSLILMPVVFLPTAFFVYQGGVGRAAALHLPAHVFEDPALDPPVGVPTEPAPGVWVEMGLAQIGAPSPKPVIWAIRLSRACEKINNLSKLER
jgi:L-alanine-DL-glutamate epimerase-like enolase superfamily enzyme